MVTKQIEFNFQVNGTDALDATLNNFGKKLDALNKRSHTLKRSFEDVGNAHVKSAKQTAAEVRKLDKAVASARKTLITAVAKAEKEQLRSITNKRVEAEKKIAAIRKNMATGVISPKAGNAQIDKTSAALAKLEGKEAIKAAKKIEIAKTKAALVAANAERKANAQLAQDKQRHMHALQRDKLRMQADAARSEMRLQERVARKKQADEQRLARQQASNAARAQKEALANRNRRAALIRRGAMAPVNTATGVAKSGIRAVGGALAGGLALAGSFGAYQSIRGTLDAEQRAIALSNASGGELTTEQLMRQSAAQSKYSGVSQTDQLESLATYIAKTGDAKTAVANWENFNRIAIATDSTLADIAETAADVSDKFGIVDSKGMIESFAAMAEQGKMGAFELKDLAAQMPRIGAAAKSFGMTGADGLQQVTGFAQVARKSTGSSEQAATAMENMFAQLSKKNAQLEKGKGLERGEKFSIYNKAGDTMSGTKGLDVLIPELIGATKGDTGKLQKILGAEGFRAISALVPEFQKAFKETAGTNKKKTAVAEDAVAEAIRSFTKIDMTKALANQQSDEKAALGAGNVQLAKVAEEFKTAIGQQLMPVIIESIPRFREMIPAVVELVEKLVQVLPDLIRFGTGLADIALDVTKWAADNPISAAMAAVGLSIGKAMLPSVLGEVAKRALGLGGSLSSAGSLIGTSAGTAGRGLTGLTGQIGSLGSRLGWFGLILAATGAIAAKHYEAKVTKSKAFAQEYVKDMRDRNMTPEQMNEKLDKDIAKARDKKKKGEFLSHEETMLLSNSGLKTGQGHVRDLIKDHREKEAYNKETEELREKGKTMVSDREEQRMAAMFGAPSIPPNMDLQSESTQPKQSQPNVVDAKTQETTTNYFSTESAEKLGSAAVSIEEAVRTLLESSDALKRSADAQQIASEHLRESTAGGGVFK